jgi:hypothetical protein
MTQDSNLHRYPDGAWGFGLPNGHLTFANGDEAMVFFADLVRRVGTHEKELAKVEASR